MTLSTLRQTEQARRHYLLDYLFRRIPPKRNSYQGRLMSVFPQPGYQCRGQVLRAALEEGYSVI